MTMPYLSIREASEDMRSWMTTPTELVAEALEKIDLLDGEIKAFVTVLGEQALADAARAETEQRMGFYRSPLHGIPIGIKDIIAVKGVRMTAGSQVLADYVSPEDATVVEQLRKAGAIILGKTNTHEFAFGTYTPPTRNPWDRTRIPGGSSGGSAAAVAADMCLGAIGSDTGGSIRIPAACCGVTGLKPTYGRVSCYGVVPLSRSLDHVGPLGRSAEDCAFIGPLDPEVRQAWEAALLVLKEEGAEVVKDVELPYPSFEMYRTIQRPEAAFSHMQEGWLSKKADLYTRRTREHLLAGQKIPAVDYLRAQYERRLFSSAVRSVLQRVDVLFLPTIPVPAIPIAQMDQEIRIEGVEVNATVSLLSLTMPFNLVGLPACSFPGGFTSNNLPVGLQVVGKAFEEATVLRIAHAYQQLTDWHRREIS
ncbi:MAG: amidase [Chloroflexi bacterium]|nr:MAG: amidase [Chloroflexota bacterium]